MLRLKNIVLISKTQLAIYKKQIPKDYFIMSGIALLFGIEVILADIGLVDYASDINIPFPKSLLFYPAIGYIVEIIFHVLPLSLFVFLLSLFICFNAFISDCFLFNLAYFIGTFSFGLNFLVPQELQSND
jgi:hypothetical protein